MTMSEQVAPGKRAFAVEARFVVILTIFECSLLFSANYIPGPDATCQRRMPNRNPSVRQRGHITMMRRFWLTYFGITRLPVIIIRSQGSDLLNPISCRST